MRVNEFFKSRKNLRFVNNLEDNNPNDRFWKVRSIYKVVLIRCKELELEKKLNIDEQMVPFRGQLTCRQYI